MYFQDVSIPLIPKLPKTGMKAKFQKSNNDENVVCYFVADIELKLKNNWQRVMKIEEN